MVLTLWFSGITRSHPQGTVPVAAKACVLKWPCERVHFLCGRAHEAPLLTSPDWSLWTRALDQHRGHREPGSGTWSHRKGGLEPKNSQREESERVIPWTIRGTMILFRCPFKVVKE